MLNGCITLSLFSLCIFVCPFPSVEMKLVVIVSYHFQLLLLSKKVGERVILLIIIVAVRNIQMALNL